jgi:hypothetical protein
MRYRFAAALLVSLAAVTACTGHPQQSPRQTQPPTASQSGSATGCAAQPPVSPLPDWARAGFSPADMVMPHVLGAAGNIVAILWATPNALHAPALPNVANKVLWVSRVSSGPMTIRATLAGSTQTAIVKLPDGPGPSYVNMPAPGCWTMHLAWAGHTDQLSLRYVR